MPRRGRARFVRVESNHIDLCGSDIVELKLLLLTDPERVLALFKACQVECLYDLRFFRRLWQQQPALAQQLADLAATIGIPVNIVRGKDAVL